LTLKKQQRNVTDMMPSCHKTGDFNKYFRENMDALGAPVPSSLFDTYQTAVANASLMAGALVKLGPGATVAELAGATVGLEKLLVASAFGAVAYTGMVIGSLAVATGRSFACGTRMSDLFVFLYQNKLEFTGWDRVFLAHPQILNTVRLDRKIVGARARISPASFEFLA
jgi:hypothetical protein